MERGLLAPRHLLALRFLALSLDAGLLVVLASSGFGEDAALLDLLVEAPQRGLERLVLADSDFSQSGRSPPVGRRGAIHRHRDRDRRPGPCARGADVAPGPAGRRTRTRSRAESSRA